MYHLYTMKIKILNKTDNKQKKKRIKIFDIKQTYDKYYFYDYTTQDHLYT